MGLVKNNVKKNNKNFILLFFQNIELVLFNI